MRTSPPASAQDGPLLELGDGEGDCPSPPALLRMAPFHFDFGAKLSQITDGTSSTLAMMEMIQTTADQQICDRRARIWNEKPGSYTITTRNPPNTSLRDESNCDNPHRRCTLQRPQRGSARAGCHLASRSHHPGGVQVLMCDASAHFINDNVDLPSGAP